MRVLGCINTDQVRHPACKEVIRCSAMTTCGAVIALTNTTGYMIWGVLGLSGICHQEVKVIPDWSCKGLLIGWLASLPAAGIASAYLGAKLGHQIVEHWLPTIPE